MKSVALMSNPKAETRMTQNNDPLCDHPDFEKKAAEIAAADREEIMRQWDHYRKRIAEGSTGSLPRDWFESILDAKDEHIDELKKALTWILSDKKMRHPKSRRDEAIIQVCEVALALPQRENEEAQRGDIEIPLGKTEA